MNPFEFVIVIVIVGVAGSVITAAIKAREARHTNAGGTSAEAEELREQILTLEDRIRVLERIVTDSSGRDDLRRQFRDLER